VARRGHVKAACAGCGDIAINTLSSPTDRRDISRGWAAVSEAQWVRWACSRPRGIAAVGLGRQQSGGSAAASAAAAEQQQQQQQQRPGEPTRDTWRAPARVRWRSTAAHGSRRRSLEAFIGAPTPECSHLCLTTQLTTHQQAESHESSRLVAAEFSHSTLAALALSACAQALAATVITHARRLGAAAPVSDGRATTAIHQ
jgi:hypothetical protein